MIDIQLSSQAEIIQSSPPFCSIQATQWIGQCPHWGGPSALFSPPIQMLISFRNTLIDKPRKNVYPALWAFCGTVKVTHKVNHHNLYMMNSFVCEITEVINDKLLKIKLLKLLSTKLIEVNKHSQTFTYHVMSQLSVTILCLMPFSRIG